MPLSENVEEMFIGPFGSSLKNECFVAREHAYCMVYEQKHAIQKTMNVETRYIDEKKYKELQRFNIKGGDIIVSCRGTIGETFVVPEDAPLGIMHPSIMKIRLKDGVYDRYYFNSLLKMRLKKHEAEANGSGIKMAISATELGKELFPVPSLAEQERIKELLSGVETLICKRKEELQLLDNLIKARFVELFGDPVKNTMGWPSKPLNDVCDGIGDGLHGTPEYDDNGNYPFINGNNLIDGKIVITSATKMVSEETYAKHRINISQNAILISINGTLGKVAFYNGEQVMLGKSACYCNLKENINKVFVYGVMKSDAFAEFLDNSSTKSTIKNVGLKAMREYKLILPPSKLQEQFATFVKQIDKSKVM